MGDRIDSLQEEPRGLPSYPNVLVSCRGEILIRISGHASCSSLSDLGAAVTLTRVYADTTSLASPVLPGCF